MPKCVVPACANEAIEEHHLWPTSLGGKADGPQIWLCSNCHRKIHRHASRLYSGKSVNEVDEIWWRAAYPIINRIVRAIREAENDPLNDAPARIVVNTTKRELKQIHLRKMDRGFSSLEKYVLALIRGDLL